VRRIDAIFAIEREINGLAITDRLAARQDRVAPLVGELADWIEQYRQFWEQSFDRLDDLLKVLQSKEKKRARKKR